MSTHMPIIAGLSAVKTGFDLIKGLREALRKEQVDPKEIASRLLEVQELLMDAQTELHKADEYNRQFEQEIDGLKRCAEIGKHFEPKEGLYWYQDYPYC